MNSFFGVAAVVALSFLSAVQSQSAVGGATSPVRKVVVLITEMKGTAEKEAESDLAAYDKYVCWDETNQKEKNDAIKANTLNVQTQESFVEEAVGTSAQLTTEIKALAGDIEEDQSALATANEQREKESEAFQAEEADMKETIGLLKQALEKLSAMGLLQKHGKSVPKDQDSQILLQLRQVAKRVRRHPNFNNAMQKDLYDILGSLQTVARKEAQHQGSTMAAGALLGEVFLPKKGDANLIQDFLKADPVDPSGLKGAAAGAKSYNSRSGPIVGILKEMQDEFERDLGKAQKEDFQALVSFQNLNAAKSGEIAAATKQKEMKEGELADLEAKMSEAKESITASNDALAADNSFLQNLVKTRATEDEEYDARNKIRSDEIKNLGDVLTVLTGDEARTLFAKTISFIQVESQTQTMAQQRLSKRAMRRLMDIGKKHHNMALVGLAVRVHLDAFTKVKESMDKMLVVLKEQQANEYKTWETCKSDIDKQEDEIREAEETQSDLAEKNQDLENTLATLKAGISSFETEVGEMHVSLKQAGEQRKAQNLAYQVAVSDQRATVKILNMALGKLKSFYNFRQTSSTAKVAQQPATDEYSKSAGAGGVMQLMTMIISDAEREEQQLVLSENSEQAAYVTLAADTSSSLAAADAAIEEKQKISASAAGEKSETNGAQTANDQELETFRELLAGLHTGCDYLLKNFDLRQKARTEEMDAIAEGKAILSGAK